MSRSFLPTRESDLVLWTTNFADLIDGAPEDYGLTPIPTAAFKALNDTWAAALATAVHPATRSPMNIELKNTAKAEVVAEARRLARLAQAASVMTDGKRAQLGITVADTDRTPVPPPASAPTVEIEGVEGWSVALKMHGADTSRRGKPSGVAGALLYSYIGETPPASLEAWKFEGPLTRTTAQVDMAHTLAPGTKVWVTARWINPTGEPGPTAAPAAARVGYGGLSMAA